MEKLQKFVALDKKLTPSELIRTIRQMITEEFDASSLYVQLSESTTDKNAIKVLLDIADEERIHAGEFMRLLCELAPSEMNFHESGAKEVEDLLGLKAME